jgi:AraC-like DNA-binding protein/TolB-like protein
MADNSLRDKLFLERINKFLDENIENENYGVSELLVSLEISRTQLHRKLKSTAGKSTSRYIREFRLKKAHEMLKEDTATASEIAYSVGFANPSYFSTAFKKLYGYSPGETKFQNDSVEPIKKKMKWPLWMAIGILFLGLFGYLGYQYVGNKYSQEIKIEEPAIDKEKTIAVLAFEDLSEDQTQKYLGMGLAVEVINILDNVEGLKVVGKTSAFSFLNKEITIDSIATLLDVNYILEGTISHNNGVKNIIAILTDGVTGKTLFSKSFKNSKDGAFYSINDIAKQVAFELKTRVNNDVVLSSSHSDAKLMAIEQKAYYKMAKGKSENEIKDIWDECLYVDSTYIPCIANRSRYAESAEEHLSYVNKLMDLDSTDSYTYFVKGNYFFEEHSDFKNAYLNYKKMLEKKPSDPRVLSEAAFRVGFFDIENGLKHLHEAMNNDPLYYRNYYHLAQLYLYKGEYQKSLDLYYEMQTITDRSFPWQIIFINIHGGFYEEAEIALGKYLLDPEPGISKQSLKNLTDTVELFIAASNKEELEFEKKLEIFIKKGLYPYVIACSLVLYGDHDRSFEWLEIGFETKDIRFFEELKYAPWFQDMREDPRWPIFMKKLGMPGYTSDKVKL